MVRPACQAQGNSECHGKPTDASSKGVEPLLRYPERRHLERRRGCFYRRVARSAGAVCASALVRVLEVCIIYLAAGLFLRVFNVGCAHPDNGCGWRWCWEARGLAVVRDGGSVEVQRHDALRVGS